jgi:YfiH family protein
MKYRFTNRTGGASSGAFASLNFGLHVGDEPSSVLANRKRLSDEIGEIQFMSQVHGNRVAIIEQVTDEAPTCDALVTGIAGISLAVQVADCIPLLLYSAESVAAVHVGRKGLINGVTLAALEVMRDIGSSEISAVIGPSICGSCYEVSQEIFDEVTSLYPDSRAMTPRRTPSLNLPAALKTLLADERVTIIDEGRCTLENPDLFSYRRDGVTGRQIGVISL